ncbi:zinc finger BED domain-containing protein 4-like [Palaemon carinicauda]|uniref:zinc finger BED domain-containing protein 4-like n=1 Tax=Palaemon carinicauda TaxID=392227 RepID=UPI0035B5A550
MTHSSRSPTWGQLADRSGSGIDHQSMTVSGYRKILSSVSESPESPHFNISSVDFDSNHAASRKTCKKVLCGTSWNRSPPPPNIVSIASHFAQQTLPGVFAKKDGYKEGGLKKQQLDKLVIKMIATDLQPISIVEDKGFKNFVHGLDPRYVMPSRRDLTRKYLPAMYDEAVKQVQGELRETPHVSLTTDLWTSSQTRGFITVTAHYINSEWNLKSAVLETARLKVDHTAENIADELKRICTRWEILDKVCCIITDNAANIVAAVTKYMQIKQQPCFAHTLNLVVQDSIKNTNEIKLSQEKIKRIVSFFHHSVKATDKLSEIQNQNGVERKKLIMDVDTRWNSTFYMMERFLEQHEAITTTLCLLGKSNMCLSSEELEVVKGAVLLLGPFEEATREMSTENFTSLSKVIPITRALQQCINSNAHMRTGFGTELQKQLQKRFATVKRCSSWEQQRC